jgi:uncharacterized heparinase superfamily protein
VYKLASLIDSTDVEFLNERQSIRSASDWNRPDLSKLWLYNLHYFDDLDAAGASERIGLQRKWVDRWITDNPAALGNGWEPYPLSLRIVNWIKWISGHGLAERHWLDSLALQTKVLRQKLEYHLLGNHLFVNAKTLVFAGAFFSGTESDEWLEKGLSILRKELPEQFLPDGGHFELSPMYHASLLWDILDLITLARISDSARLGSEEPIWIAYAKRALTWLAGMCHGDGQISFFNDAAFDIAPHPRQVFGYADELQIACARPEPKRHAVAVRHFASSGYLRLEWDDATALLDVARVGPDYLPGHAHADTLSFEFSLGEQRVLVNTGTSQYGNDSERQRQRGTAAHTTVLINGQDSSEVWAGFRVARRAYPFDLSISNTEDSVSIVCSHDGYRRLKGRPVHRRQWFAKERTLTISDTIEGNFERAQARFHLHPDVKARLNGDVLVLTLANGKTMRLTAEGGTIELEASTWHPRFGQSLDSQCVAVSFKGTTVHTTVDW